MLKNSSLPDKWQSLTSETPARLCASYTQQKQSEAGEACKSKEAMLRLPDSNLFTVTEEKHKNRSISTEDENKNTYLLKSGLGLSQKS